jgi:hypothetical protein
MEDINTFEKVAFSGKKPILISTKFHKYLTLKKVEGDYPSFETYLKNITGYFEDQKRDNLMNGKENKTRQDLREDNKIEENNS